MPDITSLRPIERRILAMQGDGHSIDDIAGRLNRSPEHVERMVEWTEIPRTGAPYKFNEALEARVLAMRGEGQDYEEIGRRFNRSADNVRQIEALAHYRRAVELLRSRD
jgi:DNA-binding CsgD family transcriptional regulator